MRVIGGEFRSRQLKSPEGLETRPTPDRLRESLFNILAPRIEGTVFVDAYAGSGAVGIEALSRGASRAVFIERSRASVGVIRDNLAALGLAGRAEVFTGKAATVLERLEADIYFVDPPYELEEEYDLSLGVLGAKERGLVIVQHHPKHPPAERYGSLLRKRTVTHGSNAASFYEHSGEAVRHDDSHDTGRTPDAHRPRE